MVLGESSRNLREKDEFWSTATSMSTIAVPRLTIDRLNLIDNVRLLEELIATLVHDKDVVDVYDQGGALSDVCA